jgi:putative transposase
MAKKKVPTLSIQEKRAMIERENKSLSVSRQCEIIDLNRSTYNLNPENKIQEEGILNMELMRLMDEVYNEFPDYGVERMTTALKELGHQVNAKRVRRLFRKMGIEAIYPKPRLSLQNKAHKIYPYLLRDLKIIRPDQVWAVDITYIRLGKGFCYLVAIIDLYSRYIVDWEVSNTLDESFCVSCLRRALSRGRKPEILNSDQGCQFTGEAFTSVLKEAGIRISMDGKGRAIDNIFIERFWRSLKCEEVYLKDYRNVFEAKHNISAYMEKYNTRRIHTQIDEIYPAVAYNGTQEMSA